MNTLTKAREHSRKLRLEADELLKKTSLRPLLEEFGEVTLGGSYKYDLLVDRDLDFGVTIKNVDPAIRSEIAKTFSAQTWSYGVNLTDRINFEPLSNLSAPLGLYLGLIIPFPVERWNVDVWFTLEHQSIDRSLEEKIMSAKQDQRDEILLRKYEVMSTGKKEKGVTSVEIYRAVLK